MTLDEAIEHEIQKAKDQRCHICTWDEEYSKKCEKWAEEHEQLANWLEELKGLRKEKDKFDRNVKFFNEINVNSHKEGYDKAIDDFVEHIRTYYALKQEMGYVATTYEYLIKYIYELAEQLKAGGKNESK